MQDVHHPRLYQVAEQEFQKTNWKLYLLVGFRILTTGNLFFFAQIKCYKQVVITKLLPQICTVFN